MSAFDQGATTSIYGRVEFNIDRRKASAISTGLILAGILIALPPAAHRSIFASGTEASAATVAFAGAALLISTGIYLLMRTALWHGPAIVIDAFGIHDRRSGAIMTPWSCVHDVRILDRHGQHIGIDLGGAPSLPPKGKLPWPLTALNRHQTESLTIIDTFFLKSVTGNRILDFIMPLTALTPIDLSDTPVSPETLSADARIARKRASMIWVFVLVAGLIPGIAALSIIA